MCRRRLTWAAVRHAAWRSRTRVLWRERRTHVRRSSSPVGSCRPAAISPAAGLVPEAVVVVFDQVWPIEQRVAVVAGSGLERSPQQAGHAPDAIADVCPGGARSAWA